MGIIAETNYFGNFTQSDDPKVLIIPTPYEYTTSFIKGTKHGPQAILNASTNLNLFDDELWLEIKSIGINTTDFVNVEFVNNKTPQPFIQIEQAVRNTVVNGSLPVLIGGEHSISLGGIKAVYELYPDVSVLYFGAQPHLQSSYQNNKFSNVCTFKQINEIMPDLKVFQIGIRSISKEEAECLENGNVNVEVYFSKDKKNWKLADLLSNLSKNVYISFNFNALDLGIMPSTSNPEPGGLSFEEATEIIKNVCAFKDIVGMDFVELAPIHGLTAPDYLAAKLIYKTIGYAFARELGVFSEEEKGTLEKV